MAIQAVASLIVVCYSIIQMMGKFKEIRASVDLQAKSWETLGNLPSFYMFHHRGKVLSGNYFNDDEWWPNLYLCRVIYQINDKGLWYRTCFSTTSLIKPTSCQLIRKLDNNPEKNTKTEVMYTRLLVTPSVMPTPNVNCYCHLRFGKEKKTNVAHRVFYRGKYKA